MGKVLLPYTHLTLILIFSTQHGPPRSAWDDPEQSKEVSPGHWTQASMAKTALYLPYPLKKNAFC